MADFNSSSFLKIKAQITENMEKKNSTSRDRGKKEA